MAKLQAADEVVKNSDDDSGMIMLSEPIAMEGMVTDTPETPPSNTEEATVIGKLDDHVEFSAGFTNPIAPIPEDLTNTRIVLEQNNSEPSVDVVEEKTSLGISIPQVAFVEEREEGTKLGIQTSSFEAMANDEPALEAQAYEHINEPVFEPVFKSVADIAAEPAAELITDTPKEPVKEPPTFEKFRNKMKALVSSKIPPNPNRRDINAEDSRPIENQISANDVPYLFSGSGSNHISREVLREVPHVVSDPVEAIKKIMATTGSGFKDMETFKQYLAMREQDHAIMQVQLTYAKEELQKAADEMHRLRDENADAKSWREQAESITKRLEDDKAQLLQIKDAELGRMRSELAQKNDLIKILEEKVNNGDEKSVAFRNQVKLDIRRIRIRERDLEGRLEIMKKDCEALIASRENKILELKRRNDTLEFNYELIIGRNEAERKLIEEMKIRDAHVKKVLSTASGMLSSSVVKIEDYNDAKRSEESDQDQDVKIV